MFRLSILLSAFLLGSYCTKAEDTLRLSLNQADSIFIKNNLQLLAEQYNIEASKALILQARLWNNPTFYSEWSTYNNTNNKFFDVGRSGEKVFNIEQVIQLAGKRNKRIQLATSSKEMNEHMFYELLRTLKFQLRSNFYHIYFNEVTVRGYDRQLSLLENTISAFEIQHEKNNVSLKEIVRLKAVYYQLYNDRIQLLASISDAQNSLQTLLQTESHIITEYEDMAYHKYSLEKLQGKDLEQLALTHRPDLKLAESMVAYGAIDYNLQKSMAVPDLSIGLNYDQAGNYINNYLGLTVGFDLPVFNRNQGNIKYAKQQLNRYNYQKQEKEISVKNEVTSSLQKLSEIEKLYKKVDRNFQNQFEQLNTGLISNFQKRNLSLIEFIDLFEAYNESIKQLNILNASRIEAFEDLNYTVGTELFE